MDEEIRDYSFQGPVTLDSPAGHVMYRAIDLALEECSPFPDRAFFLDADVPGRDREPQMRRAAGEGHSVVLVSADLTTQVIPPEEILERDAA